MSKKTSTTVESVISTSTGGEIPVTFTGTYNPGEPEVRYCADGSGHPGSPAGFEDIEATFMTAEAVNEALADGRAVFPDNTLDMTLAELKEAEAALFSALE